MKKLNPIEKRKSGRRSFTLIELLVVIAVISVLLCMLMPSLSSAKNQARTLQCMNNMKQCGMGFSMYSVDFDGWHPGSYIYGHYYSYHIADYLRMKASDSYDLVKCNMWPYYNNGVKPVISYSMAHIRHGGVDLVWNEAYKVSAWIFKPSSMALLYDAKDNGGGIGYSYSMGYMDSNNQKRHDTKSLNTLFYDGSVKKASDFKDAWMTNLWQN